MPPRPAAPEFLVTRVTQAPVGVFFTVQRIDATCWRLTSDIRVLHWDQVAIQLLRGSRFFVGDLDAAVGTKAALRRLELRQDETKTWGVEPVDREPTDVRPRSRFVGKGLDTKVGPARAKAIATWWPSQPA